MKQTNQNTKPSLVYVDYALHQKVGIYCDEPRMRGSFLPQETITWQIEGEALAIKEGVRWFLSTRKKTKQKSLIIHTDNATLLRPFRSVTQAGTWWQEAQALARENKIKLEIKFVYGIDNPADRLTRRPKPEEVPKPKAKNSTRKSELPRELTAAEIKQLSQTVGRQVKDRLFKKEYAIKKARERGESYWSLLNPHPYRLTPHQRELINGTFLPSANRSPSAAAKANMHSHQKIGNYNAINIKNYAKN